MLLEREIRHEAREPIVVVFKLAQPAQLAHVQMRPFLFPDIKRRLADPDLPSRSPSVLTSISGTTARGIAD